MIHFTNNFTSSTQALYNEKLWVCWTNADQNNNSMKTFSADR